jgi:hypothetical protein
MTLHRDAPRDAVAGMEARPQLIEGDGERFSGYAVFGVQFASGDVLALRRFSGSSVGPAYTSVWHRDASGRWTMHQDLAGDEGCGRYFSAGVDRVVTSSIRVIWTAANRFTVLVDGGATLHWDLHLTSTRITRALSRISPAVPRRVLAVPIVVVFGGAAGLLLGTGPLSLRGATSNGFRFAAFPHALWIVSDTRAVIDSRSTGEAVALAGDVRLGDFRIPRRGLFATASVSLRPPEQGVAGFAGVQR